MKRLVTLATLLLVSTITVTAQDDYKKFEFFGGYSALFVDNLAGDTGSFAVDDVLGEKQTLRGFNLAANYNFHKYVGAKFDYSIHFREVVGWDCSIDPYAARPRGECSRERQ